MIRWHHLNLFCGLLGYEEEPKQPSQRVCYLDLTGVGFHHGDGGASFSGLRLFDAGQTMNLPLLSNDVLVALDVAASVSGVHEPVHDNTG